MCDSTVQFRVLSDMLEAVAKSRRIPVKRRHLRTFFDHVYTDCEFYSALRLILPQLDKERAAYGLKEAVLARCLSDALALSKESPDAKRLLGWKKMGDNAGNFALVAADVLYRRQSTVFGNLTIKDVNDYLDRLATCESRDEKTSIIAELIKKTNVQEMTWFIRFLLKHLKLGVSEKTVLSEFHPDAESILNVSCDLKLVCEKLKDRNQRLTKHDIVVGMPIRPQLASRAADAEEAWRKLRGKSIVAECKFDGDRIQVHKNGEEIHFFSRNFIDHKEYTEGLAGILSKQIQTERCILDGEMMVWNKLTNRFADFGSNQGAAREAKDGLESDQQLCYVVFDILYAGDSSVTDQPLFERHHLLKQHVTPLRGSLELILPENGPFIDKDQPPWSIVVRSQEEINNFFTQTVENRDEGIVLKDLDSNWEPGDRSYKWIKLKPDYVHAERDVDALIIGCFIGSGRRGGEIGQFLMGLAERPKESGYPTKFFSFCRVGTGLSDSERDVLVSKLKPYLRRNDQNMKSPSSFVLTYATKERPDFWVEQPEKSVILEINSDIRSIKSENFATPYSLRFPRIQRVRYDKLWYDCLDVDTLVQMVQVHSGNRIEAQDREKRSRSRASKGAKREARILPMVPSHMLGTDVSQVKQETSIFKGLVFHFIDTHPQSVRDDLHKLVVQNGGVFALNLSPAVTHAIASKKKGMRYQAAALKSDVIHPSWVLDCCVEKRLLPLRPKYVLHLSKDSKIKSQDDVDEFGDYHYQDLDVVDLQQLFTNMDRMQYSVSKEDICTFETKHFKRQGFGEFCGFCIHFHDCSKYLGDAETQTLAEIVFKRLELGVLLRKGDVVSKAKDATHIIVYSSAESPVTFRDVVKTMAFEDRSSVVSRRVHVVKHSWLEDALAMKKIPTECAYALPEMSMEISKQDDGVMEKESFAQEESPVLARDSHKQGRSDEAVPNLCTETSAMSLKKGIKSRAGLVRNSDQSQCNVRDTAKPLTERSSAKGRKRSAFEGGPLETVRDSRVIDGGKAVFQRARASNYDLGSHGRENGENSRGRDTDLPSVMQDSIDNEPPNKASSRSRGRRRGALVAHAEDRGDLESRQATLESGGWEGGSVMPAASDVRAHGTTTMPSGENGEAPSKRAAEQIIEPGGKKKVSYRGLVNQLFGS